MCPNVIYNETYLTLSDGDNLFWTVDHIKLHNLFSSIVKHHISPPSYWAHISKASVLLNIIFELPDHPRSYNAQLKDLSQLITNYYTWLRQNWTNSKSLKSVELWGQIAQLVVCGNIFMQGT